MAVVPCVTAPLKRGKSPAKGNVPQSLMKLHFSLCELASWLLPEVARQSSIVGAPACAARLNSGTQPLHGVEEAEKEKHKRYPDSPAPMEIKPVAVGTQIELGASAREVIGMLAKRAAARTSAGLTPTSAAVARETRIILGELGIGVMRAQAAQILVYVDSTPHAAIAKILGRGAVRRNLGRRVPAKLFVRL